MPTTPVNELGASQLRADRRECSDTYNKIVHSIDNLRVIECREGSQWIIQRRRPGKQPVGNTWSAIGYYVSRDALLRLWRTQTGSVPTELAALPENFIRSTKRLG